MKRRAATPPSPPRCLAASLALHALLLAGAGVAASVLPPRLAPEAGAGGIAVHVVAQADEAPGPPAPAAAPAATAPAASAMPAAPADTPAAAPLARTAPPERLSNATAPAPAAPSRPTPGGAADAGADAAPSAIHCPAPAYPAAARRAGREGAVRLRVIIAANGRVAEAVIVESSGRRDLDEAAQRTILREWRYAPARRGGIAVAVEETVRIEFRLSAS